MTLPPLPQIADVESLERTRIKVVKALKEKTFRAFPTTPPPLDLETRFTFRSGDDTGHRFAFTSEEGWRLQGDLRLHGDVPRPAPTIIALRAPESGRLKDQRRAPRPTEREFRPQCGACGYTGQRFYRRNLLSATFREVRKGGPRFEASHHAAAPPGGRAERR